MEGPETEEPGPDVGVQIALAAPWRLRVVEVQRPEVPQADNLVEFPHEGLEAFRGDEVVACREAVAGVDAHADPVAVFRRDKRDQVAEVGQGAADSGAVAAHGLEDGDHGRGGGEGVGQGVGEAGQGGGEGRLVGVSGAVLC